jgi:hypothetical protein
MPDMSDVRAQCRRRWNAAQDERRCTVLAAVGTLLTVNCAFDETLREAVKVY